MSVRVQRGLDVKDRKTYTFDNFRGVDFSTSPYKVSSKRAIDAKNLVYKDGLVRKRTGWASLCKLPGGRVNGIFKFELNGEDIILAYAGTRFYRLVWNANGDRFVYTDITQSSTYSAANVDISKLVDRRVQVYVNKNKAYIVGCGDYLVFGKWSNSYELRRVKDNEDTYIPTTTINIDNDDIADENRAMLDKVNLLSSFRHNEFLGVDADSATWTVDTAIDGVSQAIDADTDVSIIVYTLNEDGDRISIEMNNRITGTDDNGNNNREKLFLTNEQLVQVGSLNYATGKITLTINTKPQEADTSNILITFKHSTAGQEDMLADATISTIFGGGGNSNRLFISGSASNKNVHIWSEIYDYTYFPDTNYDEIGSDSSAILGYARTSDSTLVIFKEKNGTDATMYYLSGEDTTVTDSAGNVAFETLFYKFAGTITDTICAKYATASLNGDNLILTKNGVKGLEMYENLSTSAYRLRDRSRNVDGRLLKQENLADACGFVYKDKYYLSMDGVVYLCDSRFTFQADEDVSDSFNYEWWYFTDVDARVWCELDDRLCFGTSDGFICRFTDDSYADIIYQDTESGDLSVAYGENNIIYNMDLDSALDEDDTIVLTGGDVFALFLRSDYILGIDDDGYIQVEESMLNYLYEGLELYADNTDGTGLISHHKYTISVLDLDNIRFSLIDENGNQAIPTATGFRLSKMVSNKTLYITNIDAANQTFQVKEFPDSEILDLIIYNYTITTDLRATLSFNNNIAACWYTPICDLGTNMYSKTLFGMTVTTEPLVKGAVSVGYQTRNIENEFITYGTRGFSFEDIDFNDFSFESSFTSSNTVRMKERNFNFIILRYVSDNQNACAVGNITIRYKINRLNKGVR